MTINRTTLLDLPLPVTGTEENTWGDVTNNGLTEYLDIAIAGMVSLTSSDFTAGALTIDTTEGGAASTGITNSSAQYATLKVSSLAANSTITAPASARAYRVINADATYTLTVKASGQTGVTFQPGTTGMVAFNGTDYEIVGVVGPASATDNAVARFDGTTGQIVQNSVVTIADSTGNVSGVGTLSATGASFSGLTASQAVFTDGSKNLTSNAITGTGNVVMSTSPTLVTPALGTPSSATLTNATGLPLSTGVTGTLPYGNGGTGQTSYTDGQLLIGKTDGSLAKATLTAGSNVTITNGDGTITIASSGGGGGGGTSTTTTQFTATASQTTFSVTYTVGQISVYLNGALLAAADYTATNGTSVVLASGAASGDILTVVAYSSVTTVSQGDSNVTVSDSGSNGTITFTTDNSERMRIASGGQVLVGATSARSGWDNSTIGANLLQTERSGDGNNAAISIACNGGTSFPTETSSVLFLGRSRGTTNGSATAVAADDLLGRLSFQGADGTEFVQAASITAAVDGTPGANDMPGRLVFNTTADGATSSTERMRVTSAGNLLIGKTTTTANGGVLQVSNGITFPATQSACSDANTLDDYEEGTWTGTLKGSGSDPSTPVTATGKYVKIGKQVTLSITYDNVNTTGGSGNVYISGIPFNADTRGGGSVISYNFNFAAGQTSVASNINTSLNIITLFTSGSAAAFNELQYGAGATRYLYVDVTYFV